MSTGSRSRTISETELPFACVQSARVSVMLLAMPDVTGILEAAAAGDAHAASRLLPLVYDELRKLAAARMAAERPDHTLNATALVHEAYLRLVGNQRFDNSGHFFAACAESMRRILIEQARRKGSLKRGGHRARQGLSSLDLAAPAEDDDILALDEALTQFAAVDPQAAELVKLRYFAGLSSEQAATALGMPLRTAERAWAYARSWLHKKLREE
jgi:RNA polymerase sigma factor (TIGR02999 family)